MDNHFMFSALGGAFRAAQPGIINNPSHLQLQCSVNFSSPQVTSDVTINKPIPLHARPSLANENTSTSTSQTQAVAASASNSVNCSFISQSFNQSQQSQSSTLPAIPSSAPASAPPSPIKRVPNRRKKRAELAAARAASGRQSNFNCLLCNRTYAYRHGLTQHMRSHLGHKPFVCNECGKAFGRKFQLDRHLKVHLKVNLTYRCDDCGEVFPMREAYLIHIQTHIRPEESPFRCDVCGTTAFHSKTALLQHRRKEHTGQSLPRLSGLIAFTNYPSNNFKLSNDASSIAGSTLTLSTQVTPGASRAPSVAPSSNTDRTSYQMSSGSCANMFTLGAFPCFVCGKRFLDRYGLKRHFRAHTGERPHVCDICGMDFMELTHMKQHRLIHTGELPFTCVVCSRGFSRKYSYIRHMKWHAKSTMPPAALSTQLQQALGLASNSNSNTPTSSNSASMQPQTSQQGFQSSQQQQQQHQQVGEDDNKQVSQHQQLKEGNSSSQLQHQSQQQATVQTSQQLQMAPQHIITLQNPPHSHAVFTSMPSNYGIITAAHINSIPQGQQQFPAINLVTNQFKTNMGTSNMPTS